MNKGQNEPDSDGASEGSSSRQRGELKYGKREDGQDGGSTATLKYTANIAAACDAVNAESRRSRSPTEVHRLEKRRESNRLSARRCRRRRREEMDELSEELTRQSQINETLVLEQKVLKEELEREIQSLQHGNHATAVMPVAKAPPPPPTQVSVQMGGQEQALQSLLGALMQNSCPPVAPAPVQSAVNVALASLLGNPSPVTAPPSQNAYASFLASSAPVNANNMHLSAPVNANNMNLSQDVLASFLANSAAANTNHAPLSHDALAAASAMLGGTTLPALSGYAMSAAPGPVASPALYARTVTGNNDFAARLARLEASMNPVPNQANSADPLRMLLSGPGAFGAPMLPFSDQDK